jgi:ribosomal protein S18 acetylase RimI-like enzyme
MQITYRLFDGSIDDAAGILEVEAACWNEASHSPQTLRALLQSAEQEQTCWLAEACGQVVGFVHAFLTYRGRYATWELDLLAVHPNWRRRGTATELIRRATHDAPTQAARGRAMIATHNIPSARVFERVGFHTNSRLFGIYVLDTPGEEAPVPERPAGVSVVPHPDRREWVVTSGQGTISLMEVRTLLYDGIWVEGFDGQMWPGLLQAALAHACQRQLDLVGLFVPVSDARAVGLLQDEGYESLGEYHIWTCPLPCTV